MDTAYTVIHPDGRQDHAQVDWPREPGWKRIEALMVPILGYGRNFEHVRVLHQEQARDMFVDDLAAISDRKAFPLNKIATDIYRANWLKMKPETPPESLPAIYGVAVLFMREVWK